MATVQTAIVDRALRLIGQLGEGVSANATRSAAALVALNAMVDSWNLDKSLAYAMREESLTLSASTASYTVGANGSSSLNTVRPVAIEKAWIVDGSQTYEVLPMDEDYYAAIPDKTVESDWPNRFLYRGSYPNATVIVFYVPNATRTMKLLTRTPLAALVLSDTLAAPPGWERGLAFNLACELAPEYETEASPRVQRIADTTLGKIKATNAKPILATTDLAQLVGRRSGSILTG